MDGTLTDTMAQAFEGFNQGLIAAGHRRLTIDELRPHMGPGEDQIFQNLLGQEKAPIAFKAFLEFTQRELPRASVHPGFPKILDDLLQLGKRIAIFTGRKRSTAELILSHHQIEVELLVTNDDIPHPKPHPDGVLKISEAFGIPPERLLMIGDQPNDLLSAHQAGAYSLGAIWDKTAVKEKLQELRPLGIISKAEEILNYL